VAFAKGQALSTGVVDELTLVDGAAEFFAVAARMDAITLAPAFSACRPRIEETVSLTSYGRFSNRADCDVPLVSIPPVEIGT
jgi:hypothetical protein